MKSRVINAILLAGLACLLTLLLNRPAYTASGESVVFPSDANIINVKSFGAKGDGVADDTEAIQNALNAAGENVASPADAYKGDGIVYIPNGTYRIRNSLVWPQKRIVLQGQNQAKTILKLDDRSPNFGDNDDPRPMISTFEGEGTGQAFRNAINDLTVDVGVDNPGAIGVRFMNNNQGGLRNVTIRSSDPNQAGAIGLALTYPWPGPGLVSQVTIVGFDYGVIVRHAEYSMVFEHLVLKRQRIAGINNSDNIVSVRDLISENTVPVIQNTGSELGLVVVINGTFSGGSPSNTAIENDVGTLYVQNVKTSGYQAAIRNHQTLIPGTTIAEYVSGSIYQLFPTVGRSLHLPVKETPIVPLDPLSDWANVATYGANGNDDNDDTAAIQRAMDSGKSTIYFPNGRYVISDTLHVRGHVARITGLESVFKILVQQKKPVFRFEGGDRPAVVLERLFGDYGGDNFWWVEQATRQTLILKDMYLGTGPVYRNPAGGGDLYIENVTGYGPLVFNRQNVWARQLNVESAPTQITNQASNLWILGLKTEDEGTVVETTDGGKTEVLGGLLYPAVRDVPSDRPAFINNESQLSVTIRTSFYEKGHYATFVRETRDGATKTLMDTQIPKIGDRTVLPLYVGHQTTGPAALHGNSNSLQSWMRRWNWVEMAKSLVRVFL